MATNGKSSSDINLDEPKPAKGGKSGGCSVWTWILIIVVLAVAALAWYHVDQRKKAEEAAKKAAEQQRKLTYKTQGASSAADIGAAMALAEAGDIKGAVTNLERAAKKYQEIASGALAQGDNEDAQEAAKQQAAVAAVVKQLKDEETRLVELAKQAIEGIGGKPSTPTEAAPTTETPAPEAAPDATPKADTTEAAPAPSAQPEAPAAQPAAPSGE